MVVIQTAVAVLALAAAIGIGLAIKAEWKLFQRRAVAIRRARLRQRPF